MKEYAPEGAFTIEALLSLEEQVKKLSQQVYLDVIEGTLGETAPEQRVADPVRERARKEPFTKRKEEQLKRNAMYDGLLAQLSVLTNEAVASEDYERAGMLRDEIELRQKERITIQAVNELNEYLRRASEGRKQE